MPVGDVTRDPQALAAGAYVSIEGEDAVLPAGPLDFGVPVAEMRVGSLVLRHEPRPGVDEAEIAGHLHPVARVVSPAGSGSVRRRCFVGDGNRCVMPAFGAYTGGMDVREPGIAKLFPRGGRVFLLGRDRLYSFALGPNTRHARA